MGILEDFKIFNLPVLISQNCDIRTDLSIIKKQYTKILCTAFYLKDRIFIIIFLFSPFSEHPKLQLLPNLRSHQR